MSSYMYCKVVNKQMMELNHSQLNSIYGREYSCVLTPLFSIC